jgi:hypothetical protein
MLKITEQEKTIVELCENIERAKEKYNAKGRENRKLLVIEGPSRSLLRHRLPVL